jgi:hypothetical protein
MGSRNQCPGTQLTHLRCPLPGPSGRTSQTLVAPRKQLSRLQLRNEVAESGSVRTPIERGGALDIGFDHIESRLR